MDERKQQVIQRTHDMLYCYYCKNDVQYIVDQMDEDIVWLGTGEQEFAWGREKVSGIFQAFAGQVPLCNITDEDYKVLEMGAGCFFVQRPAVDQHGPFHRDQPAGTSAGDFGIS